MFATEAAGAQPPASFKSRWDALETWFHQTLDAQDVVGGSVWCIHDGRALDRGPGMSVFDRTDPIDGRITPFAGNPSGLARLSDHTEIP
jgi:hypothetical protein